MKARRLSLAALVLGIGSVVATGCVVEVDFTPLGNDFSVAGGWTINGATPNTANCSAAGIDTVGLRFYDGGVAYDFDELQFPCEQGSFSTGNILEWGRYTTEWRAYDSSGRSVAMGPMFELVVLSPTTHADLIDADFVTGPGVFDPRGADGTLLYEWTINDGPPDVGICTAAGVAQVAAVFYAQDDVSLTNGVVVAMAPCELGRWDSGMDGGPGPILAAGTYYTGIRFLDAAGGTLGEGNFPDPIVIQAGRMHSLAPANYTAPIAPELNIMMSFEVGMGSGVYDTCAGAGVASFWYSLNQGATIVAEGGNPAEGAEVPCGDLVFDSTVIAYGQMYELNIPSATGTDGTTKWMGTCTDLDPIAGDNTFNCFFDQTTP